MSYQRLLYKYSHVGCPAAHYEDNCDRPSVCAENGRCLDLQPVPKCDRCDKPMHLGAVEDAYGEFVCAECDANASEAAYERHCEAYHDGGSTQFKSLLQQQIDAQKLK